VPPSHASAQPSGDHPRDRRPPRRPLTVLVDDTRDFKEGRPALTARTSEEAVALLLRLTDTSIDDLWLDYDLSLGDTAQPVVDHLVGLAAAGSPQPVATIHVHSSNIRHGHRICAELVAAGYPARRSYAANMWVRVRWQTPPR
jgi:hypothetical protein